MPLLLIASGSLDILNANVAADRLLNGPGELSRVGGRLVFKSKVLTDQFRQFLHQVGPTPGVHAVGEDENRVLLRVERIGDDGVVALQIFPARLDDGLWADTSAIFGLDRAEDRVIKRLIGGTNIDELSADLGISVETARTHVRRSYLKLGVSNREQLFAVLARFRVGA